MNSNPGGGWKLYDKMRFQVGTRESGMTSLHRYFSFTTQNPENLTDIKLGGPVKFIDHQDHGGSTIYLGAYGHDKIYVSIGGFKRAERYCEWYWNDSKEKTELVESDGLYNFEYSWNEDSKNATIKFAPTENKPELSYSHTLQYACEGLYLYIYTLITDGPIDNNIVPYIEFPKIIGIFKDHVETIYPCAPTERNSEDNMGFINGYYNFFNTYTGKFVFGKNINSDRIQFNEQNDMFTAYHTNMVVAQ